MVNRTFSISILIILFSVGLMTTGCTGPQVLGMAAQIAYGGLTGDEEGAAIFGRNVQANAEENEQRQFFLSQVPPEMRCAGEKLYQTDERCWIFSRPDQKWLQWTGSQWIDPGATTQAEVTQAEKSVKAIPRPAATPPVPAEIKPVSLSQARKIKRDQGLEGVLFPDKRKKTWYLEDPDGETYILREGVFKKI